MASFVLILQHSAWSSAAAREAQDLSLALAATDHQVTLLYRDAAVLQLLPLAQALPLKDFTVAQKLFDLYDVDAVCVCQQSLACFQLTTEQLRIPVELLDSSAQSALLHQADFVLVL